MLSSKLRLIILATTVFLHSFALAEVDWTGVSDLSEADKADIARLAQNLGMYNPVGAEERIRAPTSNRFFIIRSEVISSGMRRTWREFYACSLKEFCPPGEQAAVGDWKIDGEVTTQERWRFSDGDWFVDVKLDTGISYAEAESIVLAVHRNMLVSTPESGIAMRGSDASKISFIRTIDPIAGEFEVNMDGDYSGRSFLVRLKDGEVQVYSCCGVWRA
jgi:hypothetical protein